MTRCTGGTDTSPQVQRLRQAFGPEHIQAELGELLLGRAVGRTDPLQRTVFKSLGLAVEDLAAAQLAHASASAAGLGTWLDLGGSSDSAP